jgi:D-alanyl-lipoteichoic acid acyltransferase DltB (MBOAT superfamily)
MLFNSYAFIFLFLPTAFVGFFVLARANALRTAAAWLAICSLFFYGYWNPAYLVLLALSIATNYVSALTILARTRDGNALAARRMLTAAVTLNLVVLGYFKYFNFLVNSLDQIGGPLLQVSRVALPIGISFFTFTQIAYLVDAYQRKARETNLIHYTLFVTYFPHLIAGPILHHSEMMPQFATRATYSLQLRNVAFGLVLFTMGLAKKVIFADGIQPYVAPAFDSPLSTTLHPLAAWGGALAYAMQLYFDFSGYTDMALGLSRMFNIRLPLNFNSPYKSVNIVEFWRRWHMTLSRFLRDYLYVPLGGNRHGSFRRYANLMITMLLGGLWHGAGWTFVIWGGLHGCYLVVNHAWSAGSSRFFSPRGQGNMSTRMRTIVSIAITFVAVTVAWVFFRATSVEAALRMLRAMSGLSEIVDAFLKQGDGLRYLQAEPSSAITPQRQLGWTVALMAVAFLAPNSQQIITRLERWCELRGEREWHYAFALGSTLVQIVLLAVINGSRGVSEFIYFNF